MSRAPERAADLFVERYDLKPPVDVEALVAGEGCNLEECDWPYKCDAVVTDLDTSHPRIFVKSGMHPLRRRFTLGHELGHVILGWHLNTVMCDAKPEAHDHPPVLGYDQEGEANRFASRLLVPRRFREEITAGSPAIPDLLEALQAADVSAAAGLIAIAPSLPAGVVLRTPSLERPVISTGTGGGIKSLAWNEEWTSLRRRASSAGKVMHQGQIVHWYSFWDVREPDDDDDPRDTKTLFREALEQAGYTGDQLHRMRMSVSGVIGAAFTDKTVTDPAVLLAMLYQRIAADDRYAVLAETDDFHLLLHRKAREAAARRSR